MRLLILLVLSCSGVLPSGKITGNPDCIDVDLGEKCLNICHEDLIACYHTCNNDACISDCNRAHPQCIDGE